jgi:hypothetical protein
LQNQIEIIILYFLTVRATRTKERPNNVENNIGNEDNGDLKKNSDSSNSGDDSNSYAHINYTG